MRKIQVLLFAPLLCCLLLQQCRCCNAAPSSSSFVKRRATIITTIIPSHLKQINPPLLSASLGEDTDKSSSAATDATAAVNYDSNFEPTTSNFIRGGNILSSSSLSILSTITTIVTQSLNIATAALIGSGYVGCYIASLIIQQLQHYCTTSTITTTVNGNNGGNGIWKWKWTILATLTHILSNIHPNHSFSNNNTNNSNTAKNPIFLPTLWAYSHYVNPILGGLIGCTHLLIGGLSSLLGSHIVIHQFSDFMNVRLPPLDDDGNMSYTIDTFIQQHEQKKNVVMEVVGRVCSSLGILTSFPRDCLSLYLGIGAVLTWVSSFELQNDDIDTTTITTAGGMLWKVANSSSRNGQWMSWWMNGLFGNNIIDEDGAATTSAVIMVVDTKMITKRLFALHCIVMLVKGTTSLLLQLL
eukprot:scaffold128_cov140-Skeletonema_menzelii.AAC.10